MDKEFCLEVATNAAKQMAQEREDIISVFVCGSMTKNPPPAYADVDLRVVIAAEETEASYYEIKQGVPLEWMFVPKRRFDTREDLLSAAFLASELVNGIIIHDPTNWLQQVKDDIRLIYGHPSYRIARSQRLLNSAKQLYGQIQKLFEAEEHVPLWDVRCVIFWTGETPSLLLNEIPNHRRLMIDLKEVGARLDAPELYPIGMETLGANRVEVPEIESFLTDALDTITYVNSVSDRPHFHLSLEKCEYWEHGIQQMLADEDDLEVLWPLLTLVSAIQPTLAHIESAESSGYYLRCLYFLDRLGFLSRDDFKQKLIRLAGWMEAVDLLIARQRLSSA